MFNSNATLNFKTIFVLMILWITGSYSLPSWARSANTCDCVCGVRGRSNRIVGGSVAEAHAYPWLVALRRQGKFYCGATLISNNFIVTAAHCIYSFEPNEIRVYFGGHEISKDYTEIRRIKAIHAHEYFDVVSFNNDIAVIELDKPVQFGPNIQPACLPDGLRSDFSGSLGVVAGWGRTAEKEKTSKVVRSVKIPIWSQDQCNEAGYGTKRITDNMMCGGFHDGGRDACQGDSGGPLILDGPTGSAELIGVVSWGRGCARPNLPGIYTRVVNYLPWINRKIGNECLCSPRSPSRSILRPAVRAPVRASPRSSPRSGFFDFFGLF